MKISIIKYSLLAFILISTFNLQAQDKDATKKDNGKYETIELQVSGVCGMCESRIETTVYDLKGVKSTKWDLDSGKLTAVVKRGKVTKPHAWKPMRGVLRVRKSKRGGAKANSCAQSPKKQKQGGASEARLRAGAAASHGREARRRAARGSCSALHCSPSRGAGERTAGCKTLACASSGCLLRTAVAQGASRSAAGWP